MGVVQVRNLSGKCGAFFGRRHWDPVFTTVYQHVPACGHCKPAGRLELLLNLLEAFHCVDQIARICASVTLVDELTFPTASCRLKRRAWSVGRVGTLEYRGVGVTKAGRPHRGIAQSSPRTLRKRP